MVLGIVTVYTPDKGWLFSYSVGKARPLLTASAWAKKATSVLPTRRAEPRQGIQAALFGQEIAFCLGDCLTDVLSCGRNKLGRGQSRSKVVRADIASLTGKKKAFPSHQM